MPKSKLQLRRIESASRRKATFCKRKSGLLKKALELGVLCDVDVAVLVRSDAGKLYHFSNSEMSTILAKYKVYCFNEGNLDRGMDIDTARMSSIKLDQLRNRIKSLRRTQKYIMGEDLDSLPTKSLERLQKKLHNAKRRVFNRKMKLLQEESNSLAQEVRVRARENKALKAHVRLCVRTQQQDG